MWPAVIVQQLLRTLPEPYFAEPGVHLGSLYEVDIGTYREPSAEVAESDIEEGGVALATYAPPKPTLTMEPHLPDQDVYEVRIYDSRRNRHLVAAVEIISPSNKDRPENRRAFASKVIQLLKNNVSVSIVDIVSTKDFNLYDQLLEPLEVTDPAIGLPPSPMYAATLRTRYEEKRRVMDTWYYPLPLGEPFPTLPIWLKETAAISLELEASYEETCRTLRIK